MIFSRRTWRPLASLSLSERALFAGDPAMADLTSRLIVRLVDGVSGPAKAAGRVVPVDVLEGRVCPMSCVIRGIGRKVSARPSMLQQSCVRIYYAGIENEAAWLSLSAASLSAKLCGPTDGKLDFWEAKLENKVRRGDESRPTSISQFGPLLVIPVCPAGD